MTTVAADPLRPASLDDVVGQGEVVEALRIALAGAAARGELPGHMLFGGPAGTGKTTLALCVASAVGSGLVNLIGPSVRRPEDLLTVLATSRARDVIFIDEIHRMWRPAQEFLFPVMEDSKLTFDNGNTFQLSPRLFIGATTEPERLLTPMLDRFSLILRLRLYHDDELVVIASRAAVKMGCVLSDEAALAIAKAASGVPRVAIRLVRAARDYAYADPQWLEIGKVSTSVQAALSKAKPGGRIEIGDAKILISPGKVTITQDAVRKVLSSTAYQWRMEGRKAGD